MGGRSYDVKFSDHKTKDVSANETRVMFYDLKPGTKYAVTVTARTSQGEGRQSSSAYIYTDAEGISRS